MTPFAAGAELWIVLIGFYATGCLEYAQCFASYGATVSAETVATILAAIFKPGGPDKAKYLRWRAEGGRGEDVVTITAEKLVTCLKDGSLVVRPVSDYEVQGVLRLLDNHDRLSKDARHKASAAAAALSSPAADGAAEPAALEGLVSSAAAAEAAALNACMELLNALLFFIGCPLKTATALGFFLPACALAPAPAPEDGAPTGAAAAAAINVRLGAEDRMAALELTQLAPQGTPDSPDTPRKRKAAAQPESAPGTAQPPIYADAEMAEAAAEEPAAALAAAALLELSPPPKPRAAARTAPAAAAPEAAPVGGKRVRRPSQKLLASQSWQAGEATAAAAAALIADAPLGYRGSGNNQPKSPLAVRGGRVRKPSGGGAARLQALQQAGQDAVREAAAAEAAEAQASTDAEAEAEAAAAAAAAAAAEAEAAATAAAAAAAEPDTPIRYRSSGGDGAAKGPLAVRRGGVRKHSSGNERLQLLKQAARGAVAEAAAREAAAAEAAAAEAAAVAEAAAAEAAAQAVFEAEVAAASWAAADAEADARAMASASDDDRDFATMCLLLGISAKAPAPSPAFGSVAGPSAPSSAPGPAAGPGQSAFGAEGSGVDALFGGDGGLLLQLQLQLLATVGGGALGQAAAAPGGLGFVMCG
ncbi:hypothetical protein Rsub_02638 [Raphidocelis subcapitata]|uniref:Uncharacterized protein n=1 Tax=Raphidocelis subcapitata TaxID=307507 RepID=A0A2V0NQM6_9CHLO|nr:hypothetical protein Rsub_02638 [Raphidocelis subcapitata]|eukprot:GBF89934.1 hypothetical protein Rsub_02638 [Raphidocelis subcapitata]